MSNLVSRIASRVHAAVQRLRFRYDIFISYARSDGRAYAESVRNHLTHLDFTCFVDTAELPPGLALKESLRDALARSVQMVVIGTSGAVDSKYVALEVESFSRLGRMVIPIDFNGSLREAPWPLLQTDEVIWIDESADALRRGAPTAVVIDGIQKAFSFMRRRTFLRVQAAAILLAFVVLSVAAVIVLRLERGKTEEQAELAKEQTIRASRTLKELRKQETETANAIQLARLEQQRATESTNLANERYVDTLQEQGRLEFLSGRLQQSLVHLREAYARRPNDESLRFLLRAASRGIARVLPTGDYSSAKWHSDGARLLMIGGDARLWNVDGRELAVYPSRDGQRVFDAHFVSGGREVVTCAERQINVWTTSGKWLRKLAIGDRFIASCHAGGDPATLIAVTDEMQVIIAPFDGSVARELSIASDAVPTRGVAKGGVMPDPASKRIAVAHADTVRLYDLATGSEEIPLRAEGHDFWKMEWSHDGTLLAAVTGPGRTVVFDIASRKVVAEVDHRERVSALRFSPDRRFLLTGGIDGVANLWDLRGVPNDPKPALWKALLHSGIRDPDRQEETAVVNIAVFSPDGRRVVTASFLDDHDARLWDVRAGTLTAELIGHERQFFSAAFSPDGKTIVTTNRDSTARLWAADRDLRSLVIAAAYDLGAAVSGDGNHVTILDRRRLLTYDLRTGKQSTCAFAGGVGSVSEDGSLLAADISNESIGVLDTSTCTLRATVRHVMSSAASWTLVPGRPHSLVTYTPSDVRIWDLDRPSAPLHTLRPGKSRHRVEHVVTSGKAGVVVAAGSIGETGRTAATVWDLKSGKVLYTVAGSAPVLSPDGTVLAVVTQQTNIEPERFHITTYDLRNRRRLAMFGEHRSQIRHIAYSRDGKRILTSSEDGTARLWDSQTGRELYVFGDRMNDVACGDVSPDGDRVVTASGSKLLVWDAKRGQLLAMLTGHTMPVSAVRFSARGESLVSIATQMNDTEIMEWDVSLEGRTPGL